MKKIPLSGELGKGKFALVDDEDFGYLSQFKWYLADGGYAYRSEWDGETVRSIYIHREIMGAQKGQIVDHIDRNPLNNQKSNLRLTDHSGNGRNRGRRQGGTSEYKGVCYRPYKDKWEASIVVNGEYIYLGCYDSDLEAAKAYNIAAKKYYGEFAYLNDVPDEIQPSSRINKKLIGQLKKPAKGSSSRFKGVSRDGKYWKAQIKHDGTVYHLGRFKTEEEAAKAYNDKARELFGDLCYLNDVPDDIVPKKIERKKYSIYRGVKLARNGKWQARINDKVIGTFETEIEAAKAYNDKARELYGDQAQLNDVPDDIVPKKCERKKNSVYRGVHLSNNGKWRATIKGKHIGYFDSEIEAAKAYNAKARELYGDKAKLNIIPEEEDV